MRTLSKPLTIASLAACALGLFAGCQNSFLRKDSGGAAPVARVTSATPTSQELVAYLNDNARRLQSLDCRELDLQASQGNDTVGLMGKMVCQKPRNFRMSANVAGTTMVDLGSNSDEFWFWIAKAEPPALYHCSHQDFAQGRSKMVFPFQPDWIMEALGMAEKDPAKPYQVNVLRDKQTFELVEQAVNPQGQPVKKVTVFSRSPNLQVTAYILRDVNNKDICTARISASNHDRASGAVYPRIVQLDWPSDKVRLNMRLDGVTVNQNVPPDRAATLFSRTNITGVQTVNLATGPDTSGSQLQRAGGVR